LPVLKGDAGRPEGGLDGPPPGDTALADTTPDGFVWPDVGAPDGGCPANNNGKIEREEMLVKVPASLAFIYGEDVEVNLAGTTSSGKTVWDLSASHSSDTPEPMKLETIPSWAAKDFPNATYVSLLNKGLGTYGVFHITQTKLELLGAIGADQYEIIEYSTPVELLRFPIQATDSYTTKTLGTGQWGVALISNYETYDVKVIGAGELKLPKLTLPVLVVHTEVEQYLYGNPFLKSTYNIFLFIAECYGTVARVVVDGSLGSDLSKVTADERWRIAGP
jgi:hypothetical protein